MLSLLHTQNWGWQSFAKRSDVYYGNAAAKISDALTVVCTITYAASPPTSAPWNEAEQRLLPNDLVRAFASTFNNPACSDVRFVFRDRKRRRADRHLYAMKSVLASRAECEWAYHSARSSLCLTSHIQITK